ncbi:MAG: dipeptidase, partial [Candidatus Heimdallarchaeaceae archaeon]
MKKINVNLSVDEESRAQQIHRDSIIINALDSTWLPRINDDYVSNLHASGITASNVTVNYVPWSDGMEALRSLGQFSILFNRYKDHLLLAKSVDDILNAKSQGKASFVLGFQSPKPIDDDLSLLQVFYQLGIRICSLSYQRRSYFADGCGEDRDNGLSKLGKEAVREMNKLGIIIDLSHVGDTSSMETIEISKDPVILSHSNARAVYNHFRNATDEMIRALAAKEGVICIGALSHYLREGGTEKGTTFEDTVDHIDYVSKLVGVDYVGIGLDAAPETRQMKDLASMDSRYPEFGFSTEGPIENRYAFQKITEISDLTRVLVSRGYSNSDIKKILGENMLR